ncbi:hypothetical protein [Halococcoides cellulosivorans]|uniref:DUF998 domain-containing protein n=1 Tax=Halococcoides cellulosivorans TaxID=1679096 RepID=A0A2R4X2F1_9EURY|nr:hypothetical protein [Halococcoides cellulosivorans]AWB27961.1 hypothetical protein HARCEL1_09690 [Halococcoides cellulosivorans]
MTATDRVGPERGPAAVGIFAALPGAGLVVLYPLTVAGLVPGTEQFGSTHPSATHPIIVSLGVIAGSVSLTWGTFAVRDDDIAPLTSRRALTALGPALVSAGLGVAWFSVKWTGATPTNIEGEPTTPLALVEVLRLELTAVQFVALAAVSATVVGTVAATRDRQRALVATALPIGLSAVGFGWGPQHLTLSAVLAIAAITAIPFAVGYATAR